MSNIHKIGGVIALIGVILFGGIAYAFLREPEAATAPIAALPLAESSIAASGSSDPGATTTSSDAPDADAATAVATVTPAASEAAQTRAADTIIAQIASDESEARFVINEVLNNQPVTVVGATDQVAGEIAVNPDDPGQTRVGVIQVNARTLVTDNEFRNRAIKNQILQTDQYEFITFTPTVITGLPERGEIGQTYTFQMSGDLTIRDVTRQVTFDVTATPVSETRLEGNASTTIAYADFGITIPQVRQVASVDQTVQLEIDFVVEAGS